jgi:hypothetical protein
MDKTANPGKTARLTYTGKISAAAASLGALYLAPGAAQAIVMQGTGGPLSVTLGSGAVVYWDIDGDNQRDFVLWNNNFGSYGYINLASISTGPNLGSGPINGRGIVQLTGSTIRKITRLSNSFQVGPTLASVTCPGSLVHLL